MSKELKTKNELGSGRLRVMAQGYNYSYNEKELGSNSQMNLKSFGIKRNWGFDGPARWRKILHLQ